VPAVVLTVLLSGCSLFGQSYDADYVEARQANLDAAVEEFDAASVGEIICEHGGGQVGLNQGFRYRILFEGADTWDAVVERLTILEYRIVDTPPYLEGSRLDGILLDGMLIAGPGDEPELEEAFAANGCVIPAEGAVSVGFEERAWSSGAQD